MKNDWRSFIFGFCIALTIVAVIIVVFIINFLPKIVSDGVTMALSTYNVEIQ